MKYYKLSLLIILFFCSCNLRNDEKGNSEKFVKVDSSKNNINKTPLDYFIIGDSIVTKKKKGVPQLSYKFNIDTSGYLLKSIKVYSDNIKIQEIIANKEIMEKNFKLVDWNFDNFKDITVLDNCGSGGCSYWIWNYNPKIKRYVFNKEISEYIGLEIDTISKYIIFHYREGWQHEWWDSLQYKNNKLIFVKGLDQERWTDDKENTWMKNTHKRMVDNKLFTSIDSSIIK